MRTTLAAPFALVLTLAAAPAGFAQSEPNSAVAAVLHWGRATGKDLRGPVSAALEQACGMERPTLEQVHLGARTLGFDLERAEVPFDGLLDLPGPVIAEEREGEYATYLLRNRNGVQRFDREKLETVSWDEIRARYAGRVLRIPAGLPRPAVLRLPEFDSSTSVERAGAIAEYFFHLGNHGTAPLALRVAETSCDCATFLSEEGPIPPGEEVSLRLTVTTRHPGTSSQIVMLATDDPYWPRAILSLRVTVPQTLKAAPGSLLLIVGGTMPRRARTTLSGPAGARLTDLVTTASWLSVRLLEERTEGDRKDWVVEVEASGDPPAGKSVVEALAQFAAPGRTVWRVPVTVRRVGRPAPPEEAEPDVPPRPALRLLYATDLHGYFGPCECVPGQLGGLARIATILDGLRGGADDTLLLDGGGAVDRPEKHALLAEALGTLGLQASGLARADLAPERAAWRAALAGRGVKLVSLGGGEGVARRLDLPAAGGTVRVVSLPEVEAPEEAAALARAVRAEPAADRVALVVLSRRGLVADVRLAHELGSEPVPVALLGVTEPAELAEPLWVGPVLCAPVGDRGMYVTRVDLAREASGLRWSGAERVAVTHDVAQRADVAAIATRYFAEERRRLEQSLPSARPAPLPPSACAECHAPQVKSWRASAHARALKTLVDKDRRVAECLECHSERWRSTGALAPAAQDDPEDGVTCASCHRGEREHAADPKTVRTRPATAAADCRACHSEREQIPFRYDAALEQIRHWLTR